MILNRLRRMFSRKPSPDMVIRDGCDVWLMQGSVNLIRVEGGTLHLGPSGRVGTLEQLGGTVRIENSCEPSLVSLPSR